MLRIRANRKAAALFFRLPTMWRPHTATPGTASNPITRNFTSKSGQTYRRLSGYKRTGYAKVRSGQPLASLAYFRHALALGGFPAASAIIPTSDLCEFFVRGSASALTHTRRGYDAFQD